MAERSFAGFTYQDRLSAGFYGEVYRALTTSKVEVRILHVDPKLSKSAGYAERLASFADKLGKLSHPHVVSTRTVGKATDGSLVVVTDSVVAPVSVADLLNSASSHRIPQPVAASIAWHVVNALAHAHSVGVVHGAVHPRSVYVDFDGEVKLGDFAAARALAVTAASNHESSLFKGFTGYIAPEVALGDAPTPAADVYAAGAMLFSMLTGAVPPGSLNSTPAIERVVQRALDTDLTRRYRNAGELCENLGEAIEDDNWVLAPVDEVESYTSKLRVGAEDQLDAATEDLLSSLGDVPDDLAMPPDPEPNALPALTSTPDDEGPTTVAPSHGGARGTSRDSAELDSLLSDLEDPPTMVDDEPHDAHARDPISELIELDPGKIAHGTDSGTNFEVKSYLPERDEDATPLPAPRAEHEIPGSVTRSGEDILKGTGKRRKAAEASALAAVAALDDELAEERPRPRKPRPMTLDPATDFGRSSTPNLTWVWLIVILAGVAALIWVVYTQTNLIKKEKQQEARIEAENAEALRKHRESQPVAGSVAITSTPGEAAVWLKLGRTPLDTTELDTDVYHELRLEHPGYLERDIALPGTEWRGKGEGKRATLEVKLEQGDKTLPAFPPLPPDSADDGLSPGKGVIHIESTPSGAMVWLLIGYTNPEASISVQAGVEYELKVLKDEHVPNFIVVKESDWPPKGGSDRVERDVTLEPIKTKKR